jgi:hypothetical protein
VNAGDSAHVNEERDAGISSTPQLLSAVRRSVGYETNVTAIFGMRSINATQKTGFVWSVICNSKNRSRSVRKGTLCKFTRSVCPHAGESLAGFSLNLLERSFTAICRHIPVLVKIWQR